MLPFIATRIAHLVLLVAAVSVITFVAAASAPGSHTDALRLEPAYSLATIKAIDARHGVDAPLGARFSAWAGSLLRGGLGVSVEYDVPVAPLVASRALRTLLLGFVATAIAWVAALPAGVLMAARADSWFDRGCRAVLTAILALPEPVLAIALMLVAARTGWLPTGGLTSSRSDGTNPWPLVTADVARHLVLPSLVLAAGLLPVVARHVRSRVASVLAAPFVTAARGRGVPERRILFHSALRAAAAPLVSLFGLSMAGLLSASLFVEVVTGWPGLGPLLVEATRSRDVPLVAGITLCSTMLLAVATGAADIAAAVADPRARSSSAGVSHGR